MDSYEELVLLRRLWHFIWNEKGDLDYGDHSGCSWADAHIETQLASAVEDYYAKHGFPRIDYPLDEKPVHIDWVTRYMNGTGT